MKSIWAPAWAAEQPRYKQFAQLQRLISRRHIIGNVLNTFMMYAENGFVRAYFSETGMDELRNDGKKLLDSKTAEETIKDIKKTIAEFWNISNIIRKKVLDGEDFHSKKMVDLFRIYNETSITIFAYFFTTWETSYYVERELEDLMKKSFHEDYEDRIRTITTPTEKDLLFRERVYWHSLLENSNEKNINNYIKNNSFLFCNIDSKEDAIKIIRDRMKKENAEDVRKEILRKDDNLLRLKKQQEKIFGMTNGRVKELALLLQEMAYQRLELKACWIGIHQYQFDLYKRLSDKTGQAIKDLMMLWSLQDIMNYFETKNKIPDDEVLRRRKSYLLLFEDGEIKEYSGDKAIKKKKEIFEEENFDEVYELKGMIANKGRVQGRVKIVDFDDLRVIEKVANEMSNKMILVTSMTNPNTIPLIQKAAAIVTNEGGATCHAAIVSREFNVPCIVGTRHATQVFKDGDLVEVDADKGIIRKLSLSGNPKN